MRKWRNRWLTLLGLVFSCALGAQEKDTVASLLLEKSEISVRAERPMLEVQAGVSGLVNTEKIRQLPTLLGNADPLRFARLLPSIQVNTETDGGLYMQGMEFSHTMLSIGGAPVYNTSHLLGIFSMFNSSHFKSMGYATSAGQLPRLGGLLNMELRDQVPARVKGEFSFGLISSQGTLQIPLSGSSALFVSARRSYINLLYGHFLKFDGEPIRYGFTDGNLTWLWKPSARDRVWVDVFAGKDNGRFDYGKAGWKMEGSWYNLLGSVHWDHSFPEATLKQTLYTSRSGLDSHLEAIFASGDMPSHIHTYGYRASLEWNGWTFSADAAHHRALPQNPESEGYYNEMNTGSAVYQTGTEGTLSATYSRLLGYYLELKAGLGLNGYLSPERRLYGGFTPQAELIAYLPDAGKLNVRYGLHRQNLFQTGMTNMGLPVEFWVLCGDYSAPQWSHNLALGYNTDFARKAWTLSAELYYKRLYNQVEYNGSVMSILSGAYSLEESLLRGDGWAWGANLMLQRQKGPLTGWIGYSFGRSLRRFDNPAFPDIYPSDHERLHELDVVATYDFGNFDVGGTFVAASGTPYTAPASLFILYNRIVCSYGERNARRLPAYIRLDLSANWYFRRGPRGRHGLNLSLYNVLCRSNAVGVGIHINPEESSYSFSFTSFGLKLMPSLSWFYEF